MDTWSEVTAISTAVLAGLTLIVAVAAAVAIHAAKVDRTTTTLLALYERHQSDHFRLLRAKLYGDHPGQTHSNLTADEAHELLAFYELLATFWKFRLVNRRRLVDLFPRSIPAVNTALSEFVADRRSDNPRFAKYFTDLAASVENTKGV